MRIAVTGTHGTGKTTLIEDFAALKPEYHPVPEPYFELLQKGHCFSDPPTIDDFSSQLDQNIRTVLETKSDDKVLFDRCPFDLIAYLEVLSEQVDEEWAPSGRLLQKIEAALQSLDLIVFLPIGSPDVTGQNPEMLHLRRAVDDQLKQILHEDALGLIAEAPAILELSGSPQDRLQALAGHCTHG
ncbi:AAA family ATPase [Roseibium alexandrii]|uniref:AAA family ATPase n=1 Tax=Roseibium alexandrii TaxID=388408 RepID=UPI003752FDEC